MHVFPLAVALLPLLASTAAGQQDITLAKRSPRRSYADNADQIVEITHLQVALANEEFKILRGFSAYKENMGVTHPLLNEKNVSSSHYASSGGGSNAGGDLTSVEQAMWYGRINVGTPAVTYTGE